MVELVSYVVQIRARCTSTTSSLAKQEETTALIIYGYCVRHATYARVRSMKGFF
jgi:predicted ATP-grasp superfamily ATP-dependent carboligase